MIYVGIDIAKDKHDCFITNSDGEALFNVSAGSNMPAKSLELKHTIKLSQELDSEIEEIENEIKTIMDEINSPILSIPGINYQP